MIGDRRGDIGFAEAITGTVAVCVVLMTFTSYAFTEVMASHEIMESFDWTVLDNVHIESGQYHWGSEDDLPLIAEKMGAQKISIHANPCEINGVVEKEWKHGEDIHGNTYRNTISIHSDDGRSIPTVFTVIVC